MTINIAIIALTGCHLSFADFWMVNLPKMQQNERVRCISRQICHLRVWRSNDTTHVAAVVTVILIVAQRLLENILQETTNKQLNRILNISSEKKSLICHFYYYSRKIPYI